MGQLDVYILRQHAGVLSLDNGALCFRYAPSYSGPALSYALPRATELHCGKKVQAWFDNVLPDPPSVRAGMARAAGVKNTLFGLLGYYGLDLPGAVQVVGSETEAQYGSRSAEYIEISEREVGARLTAMLEADGKDAAQSWAAKNEHWSLGGNQGKIALRLFDGAWHSCTGDAATNVIVKPGVALLAAQALDECATMRLAKMCGLPCAHAYMRPFDGVDALVVERYDRITEPDGTVLRIHQEDCCQALSVAPGKKYTEDGGPGAPVIMGLLSHAADESRQRFYDALIFNYLTASTDAHAKNYSILHTDANRFLLAPLYDMASLAPYMDAERLAHKPYRLAMSIGGENRVGHLRKTSIERFASATGMDESWLFDRAYELAARVKKELPRVFEGEDLARIEHADELASRFIPRIRKLCETTERNLSRTGANYYVPNIAKAK